LTHKPTYLTFFLYKDKSTT